jgi:hypothetical protein
MTVQGIDPKNTLFKSWESFEKFTEQVKKPHCHGLTPAYERPQLTDDWAGCGFDQAINLAERGWPEGLEKMTSLKGDLKVNQGDMAERHIHQFTEAGDEPDVGRFVSGETECMLDYQIQFVPTTGRVVKLVVSIAASCGVQAKSIFRKGAVAVMVADMLERHGLRAEIVVAHAITREIKGKDAGATGALSTIMVKRPDQPVELDRLAFMLAHPAVLRRLMLHTLEQNTNEVFCRHIGEFHGYPAEIDNLGDGTIYIEPMQYGFGNQINSDEDAARLIKVILDRILEPNESNHN